MTAPFNPMSPRTKSMTFQMVRMVDVSGVSGRGVVALGTVFPDGQTAIQWQSTVRSLAVYSSFAAVMAIHGHGGATGLLFDEDPEHVHILSDSLVISVDDAMPSYSQGGSK